MSSAADDDDDNDDVDDDDGDHSHTQIHYRQSNSPCAASCTRRMSIEMASSITNKHAAGSTKTVINCVTDVSVVKSNFP